jgi:hypothetical protein
MVSTKNARKICYVCAAHGVSTTATTDERTAVAVGGIMVRAGQRLPMCAECAAQVRAYPAPSELGYTRVGAQSEGHPLARLSLGDLHSLREAARAAGDNDLEWACDDAWGRSEAGEPAL